MAQDRLPGFSVGARRKGRTERGVDTDVAAARRDGAIKATDNAMVGAARDLARAIDTAIRDERLGVMPMLTRELRETLTALGIVRVREGGDDANAWLESVGKPTPPHAAGPERT